MTAEDSHPFWFNIQPIRLTFALSSSIFVPVTQEPAMPPPTRPDCRAATLARLRRDAIAAGLDEAAAAQLAAALARTFAFGDAFRSLVRAP
jgi:hypothetical protein